MKGEGYKAVHPLVNFVMELLEELIFWDDLVRRAVDEAQNHRQQSPTSLLLALENGLSMMPIVLKTVGTSNDQGVEWDRVPYIGHQTGFVTRDPASGYLRGMTEE